MEKRWAIWLQVQRQAKSGKGGYKIYPEVDLIIEATLGRHWDVSGSPSTATTAFADDENNAAVSNGIMSDPLGTQPGPVQSHVPTSSNGMSNNSGQAASERRGEKEVPPGEKVSANGSSSVPDSRKRSMEAQNVEPGQKRYKDTTEGFDFREEVLVVS